MILFVYVQYMKRTALITIVIQLLINLFPLVTLALNEQSRISKAVLSRPHKMQSWGERIMESDLRLVRVGRDARVALDAGGLDKKKLGVQRIYE